MIQTRTPCKYTLNSDTLAMRLPPHALLFHTFFRTIIMATSRCMNMMTGAIASQYRHIDPTLQLKGSSIFFHIYGYYQFLFFADVFRTACNSNIVLTWR